MAGLPEGLIGNPGNRIADNPANEDVLSDVLRTVRLSGSLQFCFMPAGSWRTEGKAGLRSLSHDPASAIPFHILVEGTCWLKIEGRQFDLAEGDVVAFPFGTSHQLGAGSGVTTFAPVDDLPPKPWREIPILKYGDDRARVRLLCGYLQCDAMSFRPLRMSLPTMLHVATGGPDGAAWMRATVAQIVAEVDRPRTGGLSMLERLTEIMFIELLRHQVMAAQPKSTGWLAALADPSLGTCLSLIHNEPRRGWSVNSLSAASGLSRSALSERFDAVLSTSPMRYVRDWRLCLASVALTTTSKTIATVADDAGYGTEAAFNRAFARTYGLPPAAWRQNARRGLANS